MGYQMTLDANITYILKKGQYVLRVTDKSGIFHIGHAADYAKKAEAYRKKTCAYIELDSDPLWSVFDKVILLLNGLRAKKHILSWQLDKMIPKREKVQLAYLYFIPKPHKIGTPLRPIVSSLHMPTTGISKFLDKLIRPLFDKYARSTTIIDGVDLIQRLEAYATNGYLNPTTYFCTFDITDLYIMLPQEESFDILTEFLLQYGYHKIQNIPIDAIRKLAPIVIKENGFPYENIFYRQVIGGALGSVFTLTLANILMWKWEKQLVHRLTISNEIYGRFGQSFSSKYQISTSYREKCIVSSYIFIDNQNGVLTTSVYHKAVAEPYIVPFKFGLPRHVFNNIIDTALLRVIRYSSVLSAFNEERQSIELMLLYNWYPPRYIHSRFHKFFARTIYFNPAEHATCSLRNNVQHSYKSRTLGQQYHERKAYLPIFPNQTVGMNDCLLLANVPVTRLAPHEIVRRQHGAYTSDVFMNMNPYNNMTGFSLSPQDLQELTTRLLISRRIYYSLQC
ncbi:unnamed protein product [Rotaria magnacalcarata]|uniref:Helix-turn-helix domain-containing protein n=3 Tax=Rotaria magnacalcarata TaxID=392030 RepID=A0A815SV73_9BILA|nr:unnamed protein product [Rotaria magnacalcarata]